ncbi:DedA family protein [Streptomyces sp. NY05-11A]|uniref:DedA family protein n=1 Tax=Streptomyces soliscabiei TaxID=588897 RepID=UPI0029C029F9|nr:hypothetical protein [Streptomyces sp. NY05-11A]
MNDWTTPRARVLAQRHAEGLIHLIDTARTGHTGLPPVVAAAAGAVVAGDFLAHRTGALLGDRLRAGAVGRRIPGTAWQRAEALMTRHGGRAVLLARFLPVVRTLAPISRAPPGCPTAAAPLTASPPVCGRRPTGGPASTPRRTRPALRAAHCGSSDCSAQIVLPRPVCRLPQR